MLMWLKKIQSNDFMNKQKNINVSPSILRNKISGVLGAMRSFIRWNKISHRGMLLLEAIFAIVILVTTLSVIIESLVSALRATVITADYSKALVLADQVMAGLMRQRFIDATFQEEADFSAPDEQFHYEIKTQKMPVEDNAGAGLNEVQLTVSWKSGSKEQNISLVTWLADVPEKKSPSEN